MNFANFGWKNHTATLHGHRELNLVQHIHTLGCNIRWIDDAISMQLTGNIKGQKEFEKNLIKSHEGEGKEDNGNFVMLSGKT